PRPAPGCSTGMLHLDDRLPRAQRDRALDEAGRNRRREERLLVPGEPLALIRRAGGGCAAFARVRDVSRRGVGLELEPRTSPETVEFLLGAVDGGTTIDLPGLGQRRRPVEMMLL